MKYRRPILLIYHILQQKRPWFLGVSLHDSHLQQYAQQINREVTKIDGFKASHRWINDWKRAHRIVSRRVTKFVTRKTIVDRDQLQKAGKEYVVMFETTVFLTTVLSVSHRSSYIDDCYRTPDLWKRSERRWSATHHLKCSTATRRASCGRITARGVWRIKAPSSCSVSASHPTPQRARSPYYPCSSWTGPLALFPMSSWVKPLDSSLAFALSPTLPTSSSVQPNPT